MKTKKGQITVFIVVGIIILFAVGFVIYIASIQPGLKLFTEKESEVQQYIGSCLSETAQDAIVLVGNTGGYLNVPQNIAINERAYFSFGPRTEPKIPLWYYRGMPRIPTKDAMSSDISDYVTNNIKFCLGNFDIFKDRLSLELKGNISAETTISENGVFVKLFYPLETKDKLTGELTRLNSVGRTVDVKLGRIYDMAVDILKSETRKTFFENMTISLLAANFDKFPFTAMDFSCKPKIWKKADLIDFAKNMVYYNVQQVTLQGNKFTLFDTNNIYSKNQLMFPMEKTYSDIGAAFFYPQSARFELHVRPNDRPILRSNMGKSQNSFLKFFCINAYHFTYDIEYPVLVTLKDTSAFNGKGFIFNFAFPVTINHNKPDKTDFTPSQYETTELDYDFCTDVSNKIVDVRAKNAVTFEDLYEANIQYKCVRFLCDLGNTTSVNGAYRIMTQLPASCTNGLLIANLDGYMEGKATYTGGDYIEIPMLPLRTFKINFVKHDSNNFNRVEPIAPEDTVILSITSLSNPDFEQTYITESPTKEIQLIGWDQKYHIEAMIIQDNERLTGGYIGDWNVNYLDMAEKSEITFHLVQKIPIAVTEQEQMDSASYLFDDKSYQEQLKPTFS